MSDNGRGTVRWMRVHVRNDGGIDVNYQLREKGDILNCKIQEDALRYDTIDALANVLRDSRMRSGQPDEYSILGRNLWWVLFEGRLGDELVRAIMADEDDFDFLRVVLEFDDEQERISKWPWEYLFIPKMAGQVGTGTFLATRVKLIMTRHLKLNKYRPLPVTEQCVKVLFVSASPQGLPAVDHAPLLEILEQLDKDGLIELKTLIDEYDETPVAERGADWEPRATKDKFWGMVGNWGPHVIHFVGHGKCEGTSQIAFVGGDGRDDWMTEEEFSVLDYPSVRVVFLQACESGRQMSDPYHAMSGLARGVAAQGIPAVVGMQFRVQNAVANNFAKGFYNALVEREPIDVAVHRGRAAIMREIAAARVFGLPVLYFQTEDDMPGVLLPPKPAEPSPAVPAAAATAAASPPAPPTPTAPAAR